jgi:catechol 2,3-dioxygenase-like lactoylglutathione lyase family enzyme
VSTALWLPFEVADLDSAAGFYTVQLGLSEVDRWDRAGDRGVVLDAGRAFVELASARADGPSARADGPSARADGPSARADGPSAGADGPSAGADGPSGPPLAFEFATRAAVDAIHTALRPAAVRQPPRRYPRGHYGFTATGPAGAHIMIWSER